MCATYRTLPIVGGVRTQTSKRYRAVFDKFVKFGGSQGISTWNQVTKTIAEVYAAWLDGEGYAYATEYLELTTITQAAKWLVKEGYLPASCLFSLSLRKPDATDTYCYTATEVRAIIVFCQSDDRLHWLADVVTALAFSGVRISELASLRRSDINFERNVITLADESKSARRRKGKPRQTKGGYSRSFPIHPALRSILESIPESKDGLMFHGPLGGVLKPDTDRAKHPRS